jgi:hypothetical protein
MTLQQRNIHFLNGFVRYEQRDDNPHCLISRTRVPIYLEIPPVLFRSIFIIYYLIAGAENNRSR